MLRTGDPRLWAAYGVVVGVALWNKRLPVLLTVALLVALVADRRWQLLRTPWLVVGGILAAALIAPHVVWQATHGWPQLEMASALSARLGTENRITLLPLQLLLLGPPLVPLSGAVARGQGRPDPASARAVPRLIGINLVVGLPLSLPVLPVGVLAATPIGEVNDTLVEQVGWPALAQQVADVVADLPAGEAERAILLTGSYGEAGALDRYGPELGLPEVHSGHNSYWSWRRPPDDDAPVVAVRLSPDVLDEHFDTCEVAGTVDNGVGVDNEVQGAPIAVCRDLRGTWAQRWPRFRHVN